MCVLVVTLSVYAIMYEILCVFAVLVCIACVCVYKVSNHALGLCVHKCISMCVRTYPFACTQCPCVCACSCFGALRGGAPPLSGPGAVSPTQMAAAAQPQCSETEEGQGQCQQMSWSGPAVLLCVLIVNCAGDDSRTPTQDVDS